MRGVCGAWDSGGDRLNEADSVTIMASFRRHNPFDGVSFRKLIDVFGADSNAFHDSGASKEQGVADCQRLIESLVCSVFDAILCIAKETVFSLKDSFFLAEVSELPVNVDQTGFRHVFERRDDAVAVLARNGAFDLKCFHAFDDSTVSR